MKLFKSVKSRTGLLRVYKFNQSCMVEQNFILVDPKILIENEVTKTLYTSEPENLGRIRESIKLVGIREPLIVDLDILLLRLHLTCIDIKIS